MPWPRGGVTGALPGCELRGGHSNESNRNRARRRHQALRPPSCSLRLPQASWRRIAPLAKSRPSCRLPSRLTGRSSRPGCGRCWHPRLPARSSTPREEERSEYVQPRCLALVLFAFASAGRLAPVTGWSPKGEHEARAGAGYEFKGRGEVKPDYCEIVSSDGPLRKFPTIVALITVVRTIESLVPLTVLSGFSA